MKIQKDEQENLTLLSLDFRLVLVPSLRIRTRLFTPFSLSLVQIVFLLFLFKLIQFRTDLDGVDADRVLQNQRKVDSV